MSLDPRHNENRPSDLILAALARIGLDPLKPEHREEFVRFIAWGYELFGDYIKTQQQRELDRRERKARAWTLVISLTVALSGVAATYFIKR